MILTWLDYFIFDVVPDIISYLASFDIGNISLLTIIIVSTISLVLLVTFVPRARSL